MEMEKINENTIKVSLESEDLTERGITVLDLLGNQKEIESFFYSILDEVDTKHEFRENDAVTFQLMPNRNGLELFITKVDPNSDEEPYSPIKDLENQGKKVQQIDINNMSDTDDIASFIKKQLDAALEKPTTDELFNGEDNDEKDEKTRYLNNYEETQEHHVIVFASFEDFIQLTSEKKMSNRISSLYKYGDKYYLEIIFDKNTLDKAEIGDILAVIYEYGNSVPFTAAVIHERAKLIMKNKAIELTRSYFNTRAK
ncbi:adaptor protein MecA [Ligilactobacillus sp. WILCCON 0076]|uniref:Adapter protein MecA n=1 Tax=Ligilactobacillus ubinensis TaxID=2876789 RepID=A0A9X2FLA8_9LACO|nr:adaptor protein MecA [Ligilactobacillus ubinensis]MCP0887749.1 adaptor protein MecA [Ligilactobacillus ubinensis]